MKRKPSILILLALPILFLSEPGKAQKLTIEQINKNPSNYRNEVVEVKGLVKQHVEESQVSTDYYVLTGDYGGFIRVLTSEGLPETNKKYVVSGVLLQDVSQRFYFINEKTRYPDEPVAESSLPLPEPPQQFPWLIVLIAAGAIVLLILLYILFAPRKKEVVQEYKDTGEEFRESEKREYTEPESAGEEFKTIKVLSGAPKTMVFIPGELKIVSGEDAGRSFRIAAYPTPSGNIVTIGREKVSGEREYAHIQLKEKTVSRKQAEIIKKDGKLMVKNLSETNYTQVDGVELKPGEVAEIHSNSTIRTGEVEFKYIS